LVCVINAHAKKFWTKECHQALSHDVLELVKVLEAHLRQYLSAVFPVLLGIEVGDEGKADDDSVLVLGMGGEPSEVGDDLLVVLARVGSVDGGIYVLDVDDEGVDEGGDFLQVMARHVETCLHRKQPSLRTLLAKVPDEEAS